MATPEEITDAHLRLLQAGATALHETPADTVAKLAEPAFWSTPPGN